MFTFHEKKKLEKIQLNNMTLVSNLRDSLVFK